MRNAKKILDEYSGGSLYLSGCDLKGITLPASIGGSLYLSGCENVPNGVYDCGYEKRTIAVYNHAKKGLVVALGCFIGTLEECERAINNKYSGHAAADYVAKVKQAFDYRKN